jgi:hypothetical protein
VQNQHVKGLAGAKEKVAVNIKKHEGAQISKLNQLRDGQR